MCSPKCHGNSDHRACVVLRLTECLRSQMDTFTSVQMWIILQATSGGPHGAADCGKWNRWVCGQNAPPPGCFVPSSVDEASPQVGERKVTISYGTNASLNPNRDLKRRFCFMTFYYYYTWTKMYLYSALSSPEDLKALCTTLSFTPWW